MTSAQTAQLAGLEGPSGAGTPMATTGETGASAAAVKRPELKALAMRGAAWTVAGYGASQVLRLGSNLILTRLLAPELFGIMALANVVLQGLQMFSDIGVRPSIIRSPRGADPRFLNVAWTLQIVRGLVLWLVCWALAWPLAAFYGDPRLWALVPACGFAAVLAGCNSTSLLLANREMRFGRITLVEMAGQAISIAVMIGWALLAPSVWALVAGALAGSAARLVLSHTAVPGPLCRLRWDSASLHELLSFGRWIFASTALTFLVTQGDRLLFGKLLSMEMLGVYSIAVMLTMLPRQIIGRISGSVALPTYSAVLLREQNLCNVYERVRRPLAALAGAAAALFLATGPWLIASLYDGRYAAAGWMVQIMGVGLLFHVLESTNGSALLAAGKAQAVAAGSAAKLVGMAICMPVGWLLAGLPGALVGIVLADTVKYAVSCAAMHSLKVATWRSDLLIAALTALSASVGYLACCLMAPAGAVLAALTGGAASAALWLPLLGSRWRAVVAVRAG